MDITLIIPRGNMSEKKLKGKEAARAVADRLKSEVKKESSLAVERSSSQMEVRRNMSIRGLEEVPTSMMPIPYYKLVQPGSTNVELSDGLDAQPGTIYMNDTKTSAESLRFALLRAKRQVQRITNDEGNLEVLTRMGVLGMNLDTTTPFILGLSVSSFSAFGWLMKQLKDNKATNAWDYATVVSFEKVEKQKLVRGNMQTVKYYIAKFDVENEPLDSDMQELMENAYIEFGGGLDREQESDQNNNDSDDMPF